MPATAHDSDITVPESAIEDGSAFELIQIRLQQPPANNRDHWIIRVNPRPESVEGE